MSKLMFKIFFLSGLFTLCHDSYAYNLPPVNTGLTSFLDGTSPPKGPGHHMMQYLIHISSDKFTNGNGGYLLGSSAGEDIDLSMIGTQYIYISKTKLFGATLGFDLLQLYAVPSIDYSGTGGPFTASGSGLGDTVIGGFMQWDPIMGKKGPLFFHRFELNIVLPTGDYDRTKALNPGNNMVSFSPYYALTYFIKPRWTVSSRIHYLINLKNDETNLSPTAQTSTAGQAAHINFASSYDVIPQKFRLGLAGYFLKQVSDHTLDGVKVRNAREQVFGIGPGAFYTFNLKTHVFFNLYFESEAENRTQNTSAVFRLVKSF